MLELKIVKNAVIIHGWGANSKENWFPWLKVELEKKVFGVTVPDFPNSQNPNLSEWINYFKNEVKPGNETILIGHSLGVAFILRFLEQLGEGKKIKASFLVAGFERSLNITEIENFVNKPFNWEEIKDSCDKFIVISSDNDPYIPLTIGEDLAEKLNTKVIIEHNGGHLTNPSGMLSYPKLLELIVTI